MRKLVEVEVEVELSFTYRGSSSILPPYLLSRLLYIRTFEKKKKEKEKKLGPGLGLVICQQ